MNDTKQLLKVDNKKCMLVEFLNEDNKIQTGYLCWLSAENISNIDEIISTKEEVIVYWPNVDTAQANVMRSKLKNASFEKVAVRILAYGEWTEMRQKQSNYEKLGTPNTTIKTRSSYKRKCTENSDQPKQCKIKPSKKQCTDRSALQLTKSISSMKKPALAIAYDSNEDSDETLFEGESNSDVSENIIQNSADIGQKDSFSDDEQNKKDIDNGKPIHLLSEVHSDNDPNEIIASKDKYDKFKTDYSISELIESKDKYNKLKEEHEKLSSSFKELEMKMTFVKFDYDKSINKVTEVEEKLKKEIQENTKMKYILTSTCKDFNVIYKLAKKNFTTLSEMSTSDDLATQDILNDHDSLNDRDTLNDQVLFKDDLQIENEPAKHDMKKSSENRVLKEIQQQSNVQTSDKSEEKKIQKVEDKFIITEKMTKNCRVDSITHFVSDLMGVVFSVKEMALSSMKGTQSNANASKNYVAKPPIDQLRLNAIKNLAFKKFRKTADTRRLANSAARAKLQECSKMYKNDPDIYDDEKQ